MYEQVSLDELYGRQKQAYTDINTDLLKIHCFAEAMIITVNIR